MKSRSHNKSLALVFLLLLLLFFSTGHAEIIDTDNDGMADAWEQQIVNANWWDSIQTIKAVLPGDDFDGDGWSNLMEYKRGTDPTDPASHPSGAMPWISEGRGHRSSRGTHGQHGAAVGPLPGRLS